MTFPSSRAAAALAALVLLSAGARADPALPTAWPDLDAIEGVEAQDVAVASSTPFLMSDLGDPDAAPPRNVDVSLFLPEDASSEHPVPAVVLLHGAAGVQSTREPAYARQLAALGVAAVVVDTYGARRDIATGFTDRVLNITESAMLADAFATLAMLDAMPQIDGGRVVLVGFSYGGMATLYAAQEQVADAFAGDGRRFAGHVAFYAPCIARFEDARTTGAPVLMLAGDGDAIVDDARCAALEAAMEAGGSEVTRIVYEGAYHQWDGMREGPRRIGRNLAPCSFVVEEDGGVHDAHSGMPMTGPFMRRLILGLCSDSDGYLIARDDEVRARAIADVARFLNGVFEGG